MRPPGLSAVPALRKHPDWSGLDHRFIVGRHHITTPTILPCPTPVAASTAQLLLLLLLLPNCCCCLTAAAATAAAQPPLLQDEAVEKLELLQQRVRMVKALFRDKTQTEFIIATIPTYLGVNESSRCGRGGL